MKKIFLKYIQGIVIVMSFLFSFTKQGLITYNGTDNIYFLNNYSNGIDTGVVTFAYSQAFVKDSILSVLVAAMGSVVNQDRLYKIIVADSSTAQAGIHYDAIQDTFKIRAGRAVDTLKIKLHRTVDLQTAPVSIILTLLPNNNFKTDMQNKITNVIIGTSFSYIKYRIILSDILSQPKYWLSGYMGTFSRKKVYLTASALNIDLATMLDILVNNTGSAAISLQNYWGRSMQIYLNQQKAAGTPVYEDDGTTLMAMGASVQ